jgi:general secretion pathway protein G
MAILSILVGMAALIYDKVIRHAREAALKEDLVTMRKAIDEYTLDKQQAPQSLQDLVDAHYLREVPKDPVCRTNDWEVHIGDTVLSPDQTSTGVDDVHSGCQQTAMDGTSYTTW